MEPSPFGKLQALPEDAKPITTWHDKDEAFHNVSQKLRDEVLSLTEEEEHRLIEEGLVYVPNTLWHRFNKAFFKRANTRRLRKGGLLAVITILLAAALSFSTHLISFPVCLAASCRSLQPVANQSASRNAARVSDGRLSVMNLRVDSSSYWFSGDPWSYSGGGKLPTTVGAVLLASKTTSSYTIVLEVQNVQHTGNSILVDNVTLQSLQIFSIPQHLTVWTPGVATTDTTHPYPTTYTGQPGQSLYAIPSQNVSLAENETDQLDIQVHSTVSAYLQFKLAITYHIAGVSQTLALPWTFHVIFSDSSNWNDYILQGGSLVKKP